MKRLWTIWIGPNIIKTVLRRERQRENSLRGEGDVIMEADTGVFQPSTH
jgi:hypothetical protein